MLGKINEQSSKWLLIYRDTIVFHFFCIWFKASRRMSASYVSTIISAVTAGRGYL